MDRDEAIKATKSGAIAACISGVLTLGIVLVAIFSNSNGAIALWNDPSNFFDIILIFGCAYGIYKKSRAAAVLLFVYFIFAKVIIGIETGNVSGLGLGLVFLYFYGKAIQGTFVFNKLEKAENTNYKPTPKWVYYTGIPTLTIMVILIGVGLMTMTGAMPSTEVQAGVDVLQSDRDTLITNAIISENDRVEFFYSGGFTSILEGGSVLTGDRVILYMPDENQELQVYEIYFNEIASVELIEMGNLMNNSIYQVNSHKPDAWIQLALSAENRGDVKFIESLRSMSLGNTP
jgi:hypothetical protein